MFKLLRYFSLTSLIAFAIVTALLGVFYRQMAMNDLIELGENKNVALTRAFSNSIWMEFAPFLTSASELSADELRAHPETQRLRQAILEQMEGLTVIKVKIYNLEGMTVFSTEPGQIGADKSKNLGFLLAASGEVASELTHRDTFSAFEGEIENRDVISSYVPIQPGDMENPIEGVFEVYDDVTALLQKIKRTQWNIVAGSVTILTLLYFTLFYIVRRADTTIKNQHFEQERVEKALQKAHDELEKRVEERTTDLKRTNEQLQLEIVQRTQAEEQLIHDAFHDALTGLPNRALFLDRLKGALARSERLVGSMFAVLFLNLDRIKIINDSLGHTFGDQLLVATAQKLERCLRPGDTVARLVGDEFALLIDDIKDLGDAVRVADSVQSELKSPINLSGQEVFTTASIGIALSVTGYGEPEELLRDASIAMVRAKEQGRARCEVFDKDMYAGAVTRLQMETDLRRAVEHGEFRIYYQPIVSLVSSKIIGFEALIRWQHPHRGFILPGEFIQLAEETGLILSIDRWVLHGACSQMRAWQEQYPTNPPLSIYVNLSGQHFKQPGLIDQVNQVLEETLLDARSLGLEITEGTFVDDIESTISLFSQLKALGVQLQVDDFGTGYSSLRYLHRFPIDTLKIDRSFVSGMDVDRENMEIVRTIVALARNLGLRVIAEGVETAEQLAQLRALECDYAQGYYFFRPMDSEAVEELLAEGLEAL